MNLAAKTKVLSVLMAVMLVFSLLSSFAPGMQALSPVVPTRAYAVSGIFDLVKDDGSIDENSTAIENNGDLSVVVTRYRAIAVLISGLLTITMLIIFLIQVTKFGASGDNDMGRKKAITGMLVAGIATALFGGATVIIGFFWNVLTQT